MDCFQYQSCWHWLGFVYVTTLLFRLHASVNCSTSFHVIQVTDCLFGKLVQLLCLLGFCILYTVQQASILFVQLSNSSAWSK